MTLKADKTNTVFYEDTAETVPSVNKILVDEALIAYSDSKGHDLSEMYDGIQLNSKSIVELTSRVEDESKYLPIFIEDIEDNKFVAKNVFDSSDENVVRNYVINSSGQMYGFTSTGWITTGFIPTKRGKHYRPVAASNAFGCYICFFDANKAAIVGAYTTSTSEYITVPNNSNIAFMRISIEERVLHGCLYDSKYISKVGVPYNNYCNLLHEEERETRNVVATNVFNSNDEDCLTNKVLYNGVVHADTFSGWTTTGFIETSSGKCFRPCNLSTQFDVYVGFYDVNKNVIGYINGDRVDYVQTPNNASIKYVRISIKTDILDGCLYDSKYVTDKKIPYNSIMANLYSVDIPKRYTDGNHVVWVGTSIPEGATYPKESCENNGYQCINMALGGSCLRYTSTKPSGFSGSLSAKVSELEARYRQDVTDGIITESLLDLWKNRCYERAILPYINGTNSIQVSMIVIDHGVNDAANIHSLLENEGSIDWTSRDRNNFVGAFNFVIDEIMKINPTIKIVISGHYSNTYIHGAENGYHFADVCRMQTLLAEKWAFSIMKAWEHTQISNEFIAGSSDYLSNLNTQYGTSFVKADHDSDGNIKSLQIYCPDTIHPHSDPTGNTNKRLNAVYTKLLEKSL